MRIEDDGASHVPVSTDYGDVGRNGDRSWCENDGAIPEAPMQYIRNFPIMCIHFLSSFDFIFIRGRLIDAF